MLLKSYIRNNLDHQWLILQQGFLQRISPQRVQRNPSVATHLGTWLDCRLQFLDLFQDKWASGLAVDSVHPAVGTSGSWIADLRRRLSCTRSKGSMGSRKDIGCHCKALKIGHWFVKMLKTLSLTHGVLHQLTKIKTKFLDPTQSDMNQI